MVLLMPFYAYESKIKHVLCEFCGFLRLYRCVLADIIYVFCNRCNCKLLIISHLDKGGVFQFQLFQLFQLLFSTFQSSFFIYKYLIIN